jgi:hypothetical protein
MRLFPFALLTLVAGTCLAQGPRAYEVQLSSRDRNEVSRVACTGLSLPPAERISASKETKTSPLIRVTVRCGSHRSEGAVPVARFTKCANGGARWACGTGQDALTVALPDKQLLTVVPEAVPITTVAAMITDVVTLTVAPFYKPVAPLLLPECSVRQEGKAPFRGAKAFKLVCTNWDVEVTQDCGVRPCRLFVVRADPRP